LLIFEQNNMMAGRISRIKDQGSRGKAQGKRKEKRGERKEEKGEGRGLTAGAGVRSQVNQQS
jgi:hypothetical protein